MTENVLLEQNTTHWKDITSPSKEILEGVAREIGLSRKILINCLDPDYLPHLETHGATHFIVLRFPEPNTVMTADTIQEVTTKIALFINRQSIISIHRLPLEIISLVQKRVSHFKPEELTSSLILTLFFEQVAQQLDTPLNELEQKMESFEEKIFLSKKTKSLLKEGYYIKRKASAYKKTIKFTLDVIAKIALKNECPSGLLQEVRDRLERCQYYADDVFENIQGLLNLHMTIEAQKTNEASFRTNEIMRVLTVLTIFFLPLNFLAGVYGMNFQHIPYLDHEYGFWFALGFMIFMSSLLLFYVVKKGWISAPPKED